MKKQDELSLATNRNNVLKFKIVFIGDQSVGKSSIINRFVKNQFDNSHNPTVGIDFISKNLNINGKSIRLQLWDTAGQERFRSLIPTYLKDCNAAFIIYDITSNFRLIEDITSFESINKWIDFVRQSAGNDVIIHAIGNKLDLESERVVTKEIAQQRFNKLNLQYYQVSAKDGNNLNQVFQNLCADLLHIPKQSIGLYNQLHKQFNEGSKKDTFNSTNNTNISTDNRNVPTEEKKQGNKKLKERKGPQRIKQKSCC